MKLIKHCHEVDLANLGIAQGALLGLVTDTRLEITHCFPFPSVSDETFSDEDFQVIMKRIFAFMILYSSFNSGTMYEVSFVTIIN
jgi:hypothetical protein